MDHGDNTSSGDNNTLQYIHHNSQWGKRKVRTNTKSERHTRDWKRRVGRKKHSSQSPSFVMPNKTTMTKRVCQNVLLCQAVRVIVHNEPHCHSVNWCNPHRSSWQTEITQFVQVLRPFLFFVPLEYIAWFVRVSILKQFIWQYVSCNYSAGKCKRTIWQ